MIDLFGLEQQSKRIHDKPEAAALLEVLKALNTHPAVAWCERMNSGMAACWVWKSKPRPDAYDLNRLFSWSASVVLVAWHSLPVTCATCCENWGRYDRTTV